MFPCYCEEKVDDARAWSCMLHGSETWSLKRENELALHQAEMRMITWMCGVKLRDICAVSNRRQSKSDPKK